MASWRPLLRVLLLAVLVLSLEADVLEGKRVSCHVLVGVIFTHVSNAKQFSVERLLEETEFETIALVVSSASFKEGLEHVKGDVVFILAS